MYKVKDIDEAELERLKGKRVRIEGSLDRTDRQGNPATFAGDLVLLRGTSIKPVEGSCPR
jgi:hypothetical protein